MGSNEREDGRDQRTAIAWLIGILSGAVVLSLMVAAYQIGFNHGKDEGQKEQPAAAEPAGTQTEAAAGPGRDLFASTCGGCHTFSAAGSSGTVGPDLDALQPDQAQVEAAIANGGTGSGMMPAGLLEGEEAQQVAVFVSESAGQ